MNKYEQLLAHLKLYGIEHEFRYNLLAECTVLIENIDNAVLECRGITVTQRKMLECFADNLRQYSSLVSVGHNIYEVFFEIVILTLKSTRSFMDEIGI